MIGLAPRTADSKVAVPEVTTEKSEIDKNSLAQFLLSTIGRFSEIFSFIKSYDWSSDAGIKYS